MRLFIVALCLLTSSVHAQPLRYTANFARTDASSQFHVYTSVLNTPTIQFSLFQGNAPYVPSAGTGVYFAYGRSDSDPSMHFMYGTLVGSTATIQAVSNDFPLAVDGWYAALVLTSSVQSLSVRGQITVRRSPEISSFGVLSKTYALNGSSFGPFAGDFGHWPFLLKDAEIGLLITNALAANGWSSARWSQYPATQTVDMAGNAIDNAASVQADGSAGFAIKNSSGGNVAQFGAGGGYGVSFYDGVNFSGTIGGTGSIASTIIANSGILTNEADEIALAALTNYQTAVEADAKYATTGGLAAVVSSLSGFATGGQWNASVAGASNLALAVGAGASNLALAVGAGASSLVTLATANMATSGQWNASVAGASNLALAVGSGSTSLVQSAAAAMSNSIRSGAIGVISNLTMATGGSGIGAALWSQPMEFRSFDGVDYDDLQLRGISLSDNEIWQLGRDDTYYVVVSNRNIPTARLTNALAGSLTYTGTFRGAFSGDGSGLSGLIASATNAVSSITLTGAVKDAVTFVGAGLSQTSGTFNWDGYLTKTSAAASYVAVTGGEMHGDINMGEYSILGIAGLHGWNRMIDFEIGMFTGAWSFAQAPVIPGYLTTTSAASTYQPTNANLSKLALNDGSSLTNISGVGGSGVTNIGFGLTGSGTTNALAVNPDVVMTQGGAVTGRWFAVGNTATGLYAHVGGGTNNSADSQYATVGGGWSNSVSGIGAVVGGGSRNSVSGIGAVVGGGRRNSASGTYATVGGGYENSAVGQWATVGGGDLNLATGIRSTIPGGWMNEAFNESLAAGVNAKATNSGAFVWASDSFTPFGSRGDYTFNVRSQGGVYFQSPIFSVQDTNGNIVASFSPTGTIINGTLSLSNIPSAILTVSQGNANYLRRTSTYPTNYNAAGSTNQFATLPADATSMWFAVYNHHSNVWVETRMNLVVPK